MTINIISVNTTGWRFSFHSAAPHYEYDRITNQKNPNQAVDVDDNGQGTGLPLWKVTCYIVDPHHRQGGEARVLVPSETEPLYGFEDPIVFSGLCVKSWAINGNQGQSWTADTITSTNTKPPATPAAKPEPVTAGAAASNGKKD